MLCVFCEKQEAAYACPKCQASFCSSLCYRHQKHAECSEMFYKQTLLSRVLPPTAEERLKMEQLIQNDEILKQHENSNSKTECDDISIDTDALWDQISDLLTNCHSLDEIPFESLWSRLDSNMQKELVNDVEKQWSNNPKSRETLLQQVGVGSWKPWWSIRVAEVNNEKSHLPTAIEFPTFEQLTNGMKWGTVSPCTWFTLCEILTCYTWTCRLYCHDWNEFSVSSFYSFETFVNSTAPRTADEAMARLVLQSSNCQIALQTLLVAFDDVQLILSQPAYLHLALCDTWRLLMQDASLKLDRKRSLLASRKVAFVTQWLHASYAAETRVTDARRLLVIEQWIKAKEQRQSMLQDIQFINRA